MSGPFSNQSNFLIRLYIIVNVLGAGLNSLLSQIWPPGRSLFTSVEYDVKYLVHTLLCIDQTLRLGLDFLLRSLHAQGFVPFLYKSQFQNRIRRFLTLGPRQQGGGGGAKGCGVDEEFHKGMSRRKRQVV